ncbi:DUF748 domain-containing protein [Robbsia sp. Bb-Pol-6]|uniref:DUF748 domain-containing protein n=1 Tax=Robbsia betulipollinis TaxID=2981849 RepID=A0ABT3ZL54_9BURK|nr:DUF748 domain-containing protein [Robbsia betulipollinis]MCY0386675.1 DUF748 domain-containing protein [Robbsia betulipollinis]
MSSIQGQSAETPVPPPGEPPAREHPGWHKYGFAALALLGLLGIYAVAGFWGAPRLVETHLSPWLTQRYGLHLGLGRVRFNPFTFEIQADNVVLRNPGATPFLEIAHLAINDAPSALLHDTWKIDNVALTGMTVNLVLAKDGTFNLIELLHRLTPAGSAHTTTPRVMIAKLDIVRAGILFTDLHNAAPAKILMSPIALSMTNLSTLSAVKAKETLTAVLPDGTNLRSHGEIGLEPALSASGEFALNGLQASTWLPFLRGILRIDALKGRADLSARYAFTRTGSLQLADVALSLTDLALSTPTAKMPLITMKKLAANGGSVDPLKHAVSFASLDVAQGGVAVRIDANGQLAWSQLIVRNDAARVGVPPSVALPDWHLAVKSMRLDRVGLDYDDQRSKPPLVASIARIGGALRIDATTGAHGNVAGRDIALHIHDAALPGQPMLKLDDASVTGGSFDLAGMTVAASDIALQDGTVSVARNTDGSIDWQRRFAAAPGHHAATSAGRHPWQYDFARIGISNIDVALADRSMTPVFHYPLHLRSLTAHDVANSGSTPVRFDARIAAHDGGTLDAHGSIAPQGTNLQAHVQLDQLVLTPFSALALRRTGFTPAGGPLTLSADLRDAGGWTLDDLNASLPHFTLRRPRETEPLFAAARLNIQGAKVAFSQRTVVVGELSLATGVVRAQVQKSGRFDWQVAYPASRIAPQPAAARAATPAHAWNIRVATFQARAMAAHLVDLSGAVSRRLDVDRFDIAMAMQMSVGGAQAQVAAQNLQASMHEARFSMDGSQQPAVSITSASLSNGGFNLHARRMTASTLTVRGGSARIVRDANGRLNLLDAESRKSAAAPAAPAAGRAWQYSVGTIQIAHFTTNVADRAYTPALALGATFDATAHDVANDSKARFDATLALADAGGSVKASGTGTPDTGEFHADVVARAIALAPLQPVLTRYTRLALAAGQASGDLAIVHAAHAGRAIQVTGQLGLKNIILNETDTNAHALSLERLDARDIAFSGQDNRLTVGDIQIVHPDAKIAVEKNHSVNLERFLKRDAGATPKAEPPSGTGPHAAPFQLAIHRIGVRGGSVDFSDQSLVLPFSTKVSAVQATIVGVFNHGDRHADVTADGTIQSYGSATVNGSIVPFDPRRYTDLRVRFANVRVQPLSPYTATFAGRKVQAGKLWLDLEYKIDHGNLLGKNDVRLSDFTLGERVKSPTAKDIPLNLAVSLLTDSKGEIHLSVPVRGNLDNPHFDIASAITDALRHTLLRVAAAPFHLLGKLFGNDKTSLASIGFAAGNASLAPEQREKLDALVGALRQRPLLQLSIGAPYDERMDTLALQQAQTRRQLAARLTSPGADDADASIVALDDPGTRRALGAMLAQQNNGPLPESPTGPAADSHAAYQAMFDRVSKGQTLNADAAEILATRRAEGIADYLTQHGIARSRVQTGKVQQVSKDDVGLIDAQLTVLAAAP